MPDWLPSAYYAADLLVAFGVPLALLWRGGPLWRLFWLGSAIGLLWEVPIFALSAWSGSPVIEWLAPLPAHPVVFIVAHSLWDGALFVGGYLLARRIGPPWGRRGVAVQVAWGQVTALAVELSSVSAGAWAYVDGVPWNPVIFRWMGHPVTVLPQAIWLVAPLVFVALARTWRDAQPGL